jgi:uncharacterized protein (DUF1800 family)
LGRLFDRYATLNQMGLDKEDLALLDSIEEYSPLEEGVFDFAEGTEGFEEQSRLLRVDRWNSLLHNWLGTMVDAENPLREFVALFWHHHMPSMTGKRFEQAQSLLELYRRNGLGQLRDLLVPMSENPAMMYFLDSHWSHKDNPNENFPRELMELFTLGEGSYTYEDVKEASRAFTGRRFDHSGPPFSFFIDETAFDDGEKTIFGKTGHFNGNDVIDLILEKHECARHIARSLIQFFLTEDPPEILVEDTADAYRGSGYVLAEALKCLFSHPEFTRGNHRKVKTPVELLVYLQRKTGLRIKGLKSSKNFLGLCGQWLFNPPNVAGWPKGKGWLQGQMLLHRIFLSSALIEVSNRSKSRRSLSYRIQSRMEKPNLRTLRYIYDAEFDQQRLTERLSEKGFSLSRWLIGMELPDNGLFSVLQNMEHQYC